MPQYDANADSIDKPVLTQGRPIVVWDSERPLATSPLESASQQISLHREANFPTVLSVVLEFEASPGNFRVDLETADVDEEAQYVTKQQITQAGINGSFVARAEVTNVVAKFARLKMVSQANAAVDLTATIY